jgi:hypothetical protein
MNQEVLFNSSGCRKAVNVFERRTTVPPNPLMQPTNAGGAGRRLRPALPAATKDRRLSQVLSS